MTDQRYDAIHDPAATRPAARPMTHTGAGEAADAADQSDAARFDLRRPRRFVSSESPEPSITSR